MPSYIRWVFFCLTLFYVTSQITQASPRNLCLRQCRICDSMYGDNFKSHLCAYTCVKSRGRLIPDCTKLKSIHHFLDPEFLQGLKQSDEELF